MCKNNNIKGWHIVVGYFMALSIALLFIGCATTARKNERAYQRVITDSTLHRKVWYAYDRLQPPCANDTIVGETQVLILSDTTLMPGITDTVIRPDTIRITTTKTSTVTQYIVDNRAIHELQDSLHATMVREAQQRGRIDQLTADRAVEQSGRLLAEKQNRKLLATIWILGILLIVTHGIRSIPSIRKAIGL